MSLPLASLTAGLAQVTGSLQALLWKGAALFFIFGCVELFREKRRQMGQLRMSKQEIKDEHKEMEGNPQIKAKLRSIRRDQARRRMMAAVPTATAVIVNPTHYAVALYYEPEKMAAPRGGGEGQELPGAAHPPEGGREPGAADRESAAGARAIRLRGCGPRDPAGPVPGRRRNPGVHFQVDERRDRRWHHRTNAIAATRPGGFPKIQHGRRSRNGRAIGRARYRDRAHHADAWVPAGLPAGDRHHALGDRADGLDVPHPAGGVQRLSHYATAA